MFVACKDDFEVTQLLLDAHRHDVSTVAVRENAFGHSTVITCNIPQDEYDLLVTEIGDKPAYPEGTNFLAADFSIEEARKEGIQTQKHWTLLGLWRQI